jgi:hypothetical protein
MIFVTLSKKVLLFISQIRCLLQSEKRISDFISFYYDFFHVIKAAIIVTFVGYHKYRSYSALKRIL